MARRVASFVKCRGVVVLSRIERGEVRQLNRINPGAVERTVATHPKSDVLRHDVLVEYGLCRGISLKLCRVRLGVELLWQIVCLAGREHVERAEKHELFHVARCLVKLLHWLPKDSHAGLLALADLPTESFDLLVGAEPRRPAVALRRQRQDPTVDTVVNLARRHRACPFRIALPGLLPGQEVTRLNKVEQAGGDPFVGLGVVHDLIMRLSNRDVKEFL